VECTLDVHSPTSHSEPSLPPTPVTLDRVCLGMNQPMWRVDPVSGPCSRFALTLSFVSMLCGLLVLGRRAEKGHEEKRAQGQNDRRHEPESPEWGAPSFSLAVHSIYSVGVSSEGYKLPTAIGRVLILLSGDAPVCRRLVRHGDLSPSSHLTRIFLPSAPLHVTDPYSGR
jgi:hypothetical protein